ncbi:MAG: hypothetical protein Q9201_002725 [Fulgogasparrea decipioides]
MCIERARSLFQVIMYGELFASTVRTFIEPDLGFPMFDHEFRIEYIQYYIPDPMYQAYEDMTVLTVGPYAELSDEPKPETEMIARTLPHHSYPVQRNGLMPETEQNQAGLITFLDATHGLKHGRMFAMRLDGDSRCDILRSKCKDSRV